MRNIIIGLLFGLIACGMAYGYRIAKPSKITQFNDQAIIIINENFERLWDLTNGRYTVNVVTANPDGALKGYIGEIVLYNNSGVYYLAVNISGAKIWRSVLLQDIP